MLVLYNEMHDCTLIIIIIIIIIIHSLYRVIQSATISKLLSLEALFLNEN